VKASGQWGQEHDAADIEEMRSQVAWLDERGWMIGADGLWRHPDKAADVGLTHSQALYRRGPDGRPLAVARVDAGPGDPARAVDEPDEPVTSL
jgi:hypothetical protein